MSPRPSLILDLHTFDPGVAFSTVSALTEDMIRRVETSWDEGADLILLPEFTWMVLVPLLPGSSEGELVRVAECFWHEVMPSLQARLSRVGKGVVLGTVPCWLPEVGLRNRSPLLLDGKLFFQDKLHLTPWEKAFTPGDCLRLFEWSGFRLVVIICLDIEIPELAARLRDMKVDLILCPSATETELGVERVNRCASARSVELGCYVAVAHLTGTASAELVDVNVGKAALYRPSQAAFAEVSREETTTIFKQGCHSLRVHVDGQALAVMRRMWAETNPALLGQKIAGAERQIPMESAS